MNTDPDWLTEELKEKSYPGLNDYFRLEATAPWQLYHPCIFVPALLQTETYTRLVYKTYPQNITGSRYTEEEIVNRNLSRQWSVLERKNPPQLRYFLHPNVLHNIMPNPAIRRDQLRHLLELSHLPFVTVRVLGPSAPLQWVSTLGVTVGLFRFEPPEIPDTISIEHSFGDHYTTTNQYEVTGLTSELTKLSSIALSPEQTRQHIQSLIV